MADRALFRDKSLVLNGNAQVAIVLNGNRGYLAVFNGAAHSVGVNVSGPATGGTGPGGVGNDATIGATGVITVAAGAWLIFDHVVPQNPVVVKGTNLDQLTVYEG